MNLEAQVCYLDLAKRLKELGIKQESLFVWNDYSRTYIGSGWEIDYRRECNGDGPAAFTVAELGEMLPYYVEVNNSGTYGQLRIEKDGTGGWCVEYFDGEKFFENTEANARAKMLIHLIEKGIVTV